MHGSAARNKPPELGRTQSIRPEFDKSINRKIWLPKLAYEILPWFYLGSGLLAFFTTLYIRDWFWILPHYLLFSAACIHLGLVVLYRRRSQRRRTDAG